MISPAKTQGFVPKQNYEASLKFSNQNQEKEKEKSKLIGSFDFSLLELDLKLKQGFSNFRIKDTL